MPFPPQKGSSFNGQHARVSDLRKHSPVLQAYQAYSTTRAREPVLKGCFVRQAGATQILFSICSGHCALNWIKLFFANLFAIDPAMAMNDKSSV